MANKQIRHLRIEIDTKGSKEAADAIAGINRELEGVQEGAKAIGGVMKGPTKALETLHSRATALSTVFNTVATAAGTLNKSLNGNTKKAEKGLSGYLDNLELLSASLKDVAEQSNTVATNIGKIDAGMGNRTSGDLDEISASLHGILVEMQEMNDGTRIMNKRLKQTRDGIHDLGTTADRTEEEMQALNNQTRETGGGLGDLATQTKHTDNTLKNFNKGTGSSTTRAFSKMAFSTNYLTLLYAKLAINIYAVTEAFRYLTEASNLDRLQTQLSNFSAGVSGLDVRNIAEQMQEVSSGALSMKESLQFASKGIAFKFTSDQLENLTIGARKASIALGRDFSDSMDRVLRGISKQEIELFDELGVVTRLIPAFKAYATEVGKTVDELTDYERQLALTIEVQKQLDTRFGGIDVVATSWEQLGVAVKDSSDELLVFIADALEPAAAGLTYLLETYVALGSEIDKVSSTAARQEKTFQAAFEAGNLGQMVNATGNLTKLIDTLNKKLVKSKETIKASNAEMLKVSESPGFFGMVSIAAASLTLATGTHNNNKQLELQSKIEAEILKLKKLQAEETKKIHESRGIDRSIISEKTGQQILSNKDALVEVERAIVGLSTKAQKSSAPLRDLILQFTNLERATVEGVPDTVLDQYEKFQDIMSHMEFGDTIDSIGDLVDATKALSLSMRDLKFTDSMEKILLGQTKDADTKALTGEIQRRQHILSSMLELGKVISVNRKLQITQELKILEAKKAQLELSKEQKRVLADSKMGSQAALLLLGTTVHLESEKLQVQMTQLLAQEAYLKAQGRDTQELERQIALLKVKAGIRIGTENDDRGRGGRSVEAADLNIKLGQSGSEVERLGIQSELLALREKDAALILNQIERETQLNLLAVERAQLGRDTEAAPIRDASALFSTLQGLEGLSNLQNVGLDMAGNFSDVFAAAEESGKGFSDFLSGNMQAFSDFGVGIANSAVSVFQELSSAKVAAIDLEIAAEQRRDGKSVESLAKIKKLEAKKIKEESKAKKASVVMSTAMAVMQGFAQLGPIGGAIMAIPTIAMGAMQLSNIDKASSGQLAALGGGGDKMSITGGTRDNSVDVSKSANAGEYAFMTGQQGSGNSGNFATPGRAGGGYSEAGTSIVTGEKGPEIITPAVPVNVTSAGNSKGVGGNITFAPVFNASAVDSGGMEELFQNYSRELYDGLQQELAANNQTLESL